MEEKDAQQTTQTIDETPVTEGEFEVPREPRFYELSFILKPGMDEPSLSSATETVREAITKLKGMIVEEPQVKTRELSYKIGGFSEGIAGHARFLLKAEKINELEKNLKNTDDILRFSFFKTRQEKVKKESGVKLKTWRKEREEKQEQVSEKEIDEKLDQLLG